MEVPVFFLIVDVLPDYVRKTFGMNENGEFQHGGARVVREGEDIPRDMDYAIIIYNDSQYHMKRTFELTNQIRSLNPSTKVLAFPIQA